MRALICALTLAVPLALPAQDPSARCHFRSIVRAPDAPAILDATTWKHPEYEALLQPIERRTVTAWLRVSADGGVTDVCVVGAPEGFEAPIARAARSLRYMPAQRAGQTVATVAAVTYELGGRLDRQHPRLIEIARSTDVTWLERIAGSAEAAVAAWHSQLRRLGQAKHLRVAAFARLGEIATQESLAAQARVVAAHAARSMIGGGGSLEAPWPHPGWHMGDSRPQPLARLTMANGSRLALIAADVLGPPQLFVLRCEDERLARCSRPKPASEWRWTYVETRVSLHEIAHGRLRLKVVPLRPIQPSVMDGTAPVHPPAVDRSESDTRDIPLADVDLDSDGDGWTDAEERLLGLNPNRRDSDDDGVADGDDRAPLLAGSAAADVSAADVEILRPAIFAAFGLAGSRWVLFARDDRTPRIDVPALPAPVLFDRPLPADARMQSPGGVFVSWHIVRRSDAEAVVQLTDWEGPLAAGGQEVFLRRISNRWVVTGWQTTWIS